MRVCAEVLARFSLVRGTAVGRHAVAQSPGAAEQKWQRQQAQQQAAFHMTSLVYVYIYLHVFKVNDMNTVKYPLRNTYVYVHVRYT